MSETPPPNDPFHPQPPDDSFRYDEPIPQEYRYEPDDTPTGLPWERRRELGFWRALWETGKLVLLDPFRAFSVMRASGSEMDALFFYVLVAWIAGIISMVWQVPLQMLQMAPALSQGGEEAAVVGIATIAYIVGATVVCLPVFVAIGAVINTALWHLGLIMWPGPRRDFAATFKVCCYASGAASALQVVPCLGGCVTLVWSLVAGTIGIMVVHRAEMLRSGFAVLMPFLVCCCCLGGGAAAIFMTAGGTLPIEDIMRELQRAFGQ